MYSVKSSWQSVVPGGHIKLMFREPSWPSSGNWYQMSKNKFYAATWRGWLPIKTSLNSVAMKATFMSRLLGETLFMCHVIGVWFIEMQFLQFLSTRLWLILNSLCEIPCFSVRMTTVGCVTGGIYLEQYYFFWVNVGLQFSVSSWHVCTLQENSVQRSSGHCTWAVLQADHQTTCRD